MNVRGSSVRALLAVLAAAAGLLVLCGAQALALSGPRAFSLHIGSGEGSGKGQFSAEGPSGVAVNDTTHDVYVVDKGNGRVERFSSTGAYLGQFNGSGTFEVEGVTKMGSPAADGPFSEPNAIAIDNSGDSLTDPSAGDVYVNTNIGEERSVIDKFSPTGEYLGELTAFTSVHRNGVTVDPAGEVWVSGFTSGEGQNVLRFNDAVENELISSWSSGSSGEIVFDPVNRDVYLANGEVEKFSETGAFLEFEVEGFLGFIRGLAADESNGDLLYDTGESVSVFEAGGGEFKEQPTFGAGDLTAGRALAVDSSSGTVYVADDGSNTVAKFSLLPAVTSEAPSGLTGTGATLNGTVNPNGEAVTSCQFEYGTEAGVYPDTVPCEQNDIGEGIAGVPVSAKISGLQPGMIYHFRLAASHATGGLAYGGDEIVPTVPAVLGEWATDVTSEGVTFNAQIDPDGADTSYYFQYGIGEAYESSAPVPAGDAGAGLSATEVSVHVQGLRPGVTYRYRVVASNIAAVQPIDGEGHTITTQMAGSELALPDGRQWELVTPPNKHGAVILWIGTQSVEQASTDGGAITYSTDAPTELEPRGNSNGSQAISTRGAGGWSSRDIATPNSAATGISIGVGTEYRFFSPDLSQALVDPKGPFTPLSSEATERTAYVRHNLTCEAAPAGCYTPLLTAANVPPGTEFGGREQFESHGYTFEDASSDLSHVLLASGELLTETTPEGRPLKKGDMFEWAGGRLQFVAVLPGGEPASTSQVGGGYAGGQNRGAVSSDGTRIVWHGEGAPGSGSHLYMRDVSSEQTVQLDAPEAGAEGGEGWFYQIASSDGSRVFFTDSAKLTRSSTAGEKMRDQMRDLYVCEVVEVAGKLSCHLSDLTIDPNHGQQADVRGGVLGASEDGTYVYFVAGGELSDAANAYGEKAQDGANNLYVSHYEEASGEWAQPVFIAGLSNADAGDWTAELSEHTARVSPNGEYVTFMSDRSLTGYDDRDAVSGVADEEVYLYDAATGRLVCPSCDPTGARPSGAEVTGSGAGELNLVGGRQLPPGTWVAATIPGWTNFSLVESLYQSRYLSSSGRLFFNSDDALVPQDANGTWDVYEYEPLGVGSCTASSVTFSERLGGCVSLISSGTSSAESGFMDASESGDDVFFQTAERLVPQDFEDSYDIYDAHVCSSAAPCVSSPSEPPPCDTSDSCKAAPTLQPPIFGAPASATFSGSGNLSASPPAPVVAARKSLPRAQKLARALRACRKRSKGKRAVCERQARREYGAAARSRKSGATRKGR